MKIRLMTGFLMSALIAVPAAAEHEYDYATVVEAEPIIKVVRVSTPRKECWEEEVVYRDRYDRGNGVGTVVGGVIGGAIGNAVGHSKRNKQVGTVVGAVLGATLGNAASNRRVEEDVYYDTEQRCEVYHDWHEEERIMGYDVRYRYNDRTYSTRMRTDPGDTIRVRVTVSPVS